MGGHGDGHGRDDREFDEPAPYDGVEEEDSPVDDDRRNQKKRDEKHGNHNPG